MSSYPTSRHISKRLNAGLKRGPHTHAHSSITHNSQEVEANQMSTDGWIDYKVWLTCRGMLFSLKKKKLLPHATIWVNLEDISSVK